MSRKTILAWLLLSATLLIPLQGNAQEPPPDAIIEQQHPLGLAPGALDPALLSRLPARAALASVMSLPSSVDWRDHDGDWTTPIRSQRNCGSCVAFGTLGAVEARLEIYHNDPSENPDLAEQHLFFCGGGNCGYGWYPSAAMDFTWNTGVVDESCDPYDADDHTCSLCDGWESRVTRIHCWYYVYGRDNVKYYLANYGPVEATMLVYTDFDSYTTLTSTPALGGLSDTLQFTYSIPEERFLPTVHRVTPLNVGNDDPLTWTVATEGAWFTAAPLTGTTPASFWITPTIVTGAGTLPIHTGAVTVTVVDPSGTEGSPYWIGLTLQVVDTSFSHVYLPLILQNCAHAPPPLSPRYPDDPYYASQWALEKVGAPAAWGYSTGRDVLIAILDTGTNLDHPDLADKVRTDVDRDFANDDDEADDDHGHGTHVSGIAAAATNNGVGVAGLGWEAMLLPLKVLRADGVGHEDDLAAAIRWAANNEADVINMSLGGAFACPSIIQEAVDYAYTKGVVLVAAAGNHGGGEANAEMFPANCEHVLGGAATNSDDSVAAYSNYGSHVSVAAPGSGLYSTLMGGGYGNMSGTSMATPHLAGLAALLRARYPSYTPDEIASAILDNADDLGTTGWDPYYGCGRINAHRSLFQGRQGSSPLCLQGAGLWPVGGVDAAADAAVTAPFVPGEIIVSFRPGLSGTGVEAIARRCGASAEFLPEIGAWRLRVPLGQERAILARLQADPAVIHAGLNHLIFAQ